MSDWEGQRAFLAVARSGSLSGAARLLGLAQPTVRRRIEQLEVEAGVSLFVRTPAGLTPTQTGHALADHARAMEVAADAFRRTASAAAGELAGQVRITASDVVAVEVLPTIVAGLRRRYPGITLAISPSNRNEDVLRREADIAVRMVRPTQDGLVARRIGTIDLGLFARRDYLDRVGWPPALAAVVDFGVIGPEHDNLILRSMRAGMPAFDPSLFAVRTDSDLAQLAALRAGAGIGVCQVPIGRRDPALVRLFEEEFVFPLETWLVMHQDLRGLARVRAVFDALADALADYMR